MIITAIYLVFAVIILWKTAIFMIEKKKIISFIPFILLGVVFCRRASFLFYNIFLQSLWLWVELVLIIIIILLFALVRRMKP